MASVKEVKKEIVNSLMEWGVDEYTNTKHATFQKNAIEEAVSSYKGLSMYTRKVTHFQQFPTSFEKAIRHVLNSEIENSKEEYWKLEEDKLGTFFAPYFKDSKGVLRKKKEYLNFKNEDLDPFGRFSAEPVSKAEYFFREWFDGPSGSLMGQAFEAIVACHVIKHKSCLNCFALGKFCWNGEVPWKDIWCRNCGSTYEVKSKESLEKIEREFHFNNIRGGSFKIFHCLKLDGKTNERYKNAKQYLVVVSRRPTSPRLYDGEWPVYIAPIQYVKPQLMYYSFEQTEDIRMGTKIVVGEKKVWLKIPTEELNVKKIAKDVFLENFSVDEWNDLCNRQKTGFVEELHQSKKEECAQKNDKKQNLDELSNIRSALEAMSANDDDWENGYSDSD